MGGRSSSGPSAAERELQRLAILQQRRSEQDLEANTRRVQRQQQAVLNRSLKSAGGPLPGTTGGSSTSLLG